MTKKPETSNSTAQRELDKAEEQFKAFDENVKELTMDRMNLVPKLEQDSQTKIAQKDLDKKSEVYLKPERTVSCKEKFNEKFRSNYEYDKEYVGFIPEHNEIKGDVIEIWTKPYSGVPAEFWKVPTNTPVHGPRYLAEQIKRKFYHRLTMKQNVTSGSDGHGQYFGVLAADTTIQRIDARPISSRRSIFMGASSF